MRSSCASNIIIVPSAYAIAINSRPQCTQLCMPPSKTSPTPLCLPHAGHPGLRSSSVSSSGHHRRSSCPPACLRKFHVLASVEMSLSLLI